MTEKIQRSILKSVSWRITGTLDTMLISYLITGRLRIAVSIGAVEVFTKCALYIGHERIWNRIYFGRSIPPEAGAAANQSSGATRAATLAQGEMA